MDPTRLPALDLFVSSFDNALDAAPKLHRLPLSALVRALTTFRSCPRLLDKRMLPAWSPARFADGENRRSEAVIALSCLVLDLDDADADVVHADWLEFLHVLHTTWSHGPDAPRWRLVVPLARPIPVARWDAAWRWAVARTPADRVCRDPGRLYFLPALGAPDQPHEASLHIAPLLDLLAIAPEAPSQELVTLRKPIRVPARLRGTVVRRRVARDPATRERIAMSLGAKLAGAGEQQRAEDLSCPMCGRPSVWFWLAPRAASFARCQHRNSCGWTGSLSELLARSAA